MYLSLYLALAALLILLGVVAWAMLTVRRIRERTAWDRYFRLPAAERAALRAWAERRARWLNRLFWPLARLGLKPPLTRFAGVQVPAVCTSATMKAAVDYAPDARDVFVATQMKCGTTWMQQIVYEILSRGAGDLGDTGHRHMYAVSPWIESEGAVRLEDAPRIGTGGHRIIKTHLGADLCPYAPAARYIYVTRHPAACLASCQDFIGMLFGVMAPRRQAFVDWFCSPDMWWGPWPDHVEGWWRWGQERDNVLFVHYEALLADLDACVRRIAAFLDVALTEEELVRVTDKSGFAFMKAHEDVFEMSPPTPFYVGAGSYLVSGRGTRDRDLSDADRARVAAYCRERLEGASYPLAKFYPDVASA